MEDDFETITVRYRSYFKINNQNLEDINLDDIEIEVSSNNSDRKDDNSNTEKNIQTTEEPNLLVLTVLWAYFTACQQGILDQEAPVPWAEVEINQNDISSQRGEFDYQEWLKFLNNIVDKNWTNWISEPEEIKQRALMSYRQLKYNDNFCPKEKTDIQAKEDKKN